LKYINSELKKRQISFNQAKDFAEIKYGTRAWLSNNGYDAKNKPLELQLCLEAYNKK
jgi:hypothetical protein